MNIVKASSSEFRAVAKFARYAYENANREEIGSTTLRQHLIDKMSDELFKQMLFVDDFYLAYISKLLVGFAQVGGVDSCYAEYLDEFDSAGSEIRRLYVKPELKRRGIGSALMQRSMKELDQVEVQNVYLTTWETNLDAQIFYTQQGFEKIGQIPEFSTDGSLNGYEHIMIRKQ